MPGLEFRYVKQGARRSRSRERFRPSPYDGSAHSIESRESRVARIYALATGRKKSLRCTACCCVTLSSSGPMQSSGPHSANVATMTIPHGFTARRNGPNVCLAFLSNLTTQGCATDERVSDQSLRKPSPRLTAAISIRLIPYKAARLRLRRVLRASRQRRRLSVHQGIRRLRATRRRCQ
jgi:hypothetical protein